MVNRATAGDFASTPTLARRAATLATLVVLAGGTATAFVLWKSAQVEETPVAVASLPIPTTVTALGRLEPAGEVIAISAPGITESNRIDRLLVKQGDWVEAGDAIAILDNYERQQAAVEQAREQVSLARAKLEQVKAGAKIGELDAQQATIARLEMERQTDMDAQRAAIARLETERRTDIEATEAKIARLKAQQRGELEAQRATISRIEAEYRNALNEERRHDQLHAQGAISEELRDRKRLDRETAEQRWQEAKVNLTRIQNTYDQQIQETEAELTKIRLAQQEQIREAQAHLDRLDRAGLEKIAEARATWDKIAEVRPVDIAVAEAELRSVLATLTEAEADLKLAEIRAPRDGQILEIHTYPGEKVSNSGIVELGQTREMVAIAQVYESDIHRVQIGQTARITSDSFEGELRGKVDRIGLQIQRQDVINADPSANIDGRVIEVRVHLDEASSQKVSGLTNLQVRVVIGK
ncbi:MAG: HlyD family efflux transporter periplasmic adaptor subunit [Limnospira sp.]